MPNKKTNIVRGTVRDQYENPAAKLLIRAYDDTPSGRTLLGTTLTEETGEYSIHYNYADLNKLNLVLSVYDAQGTFIDESKHYDDVTKTKTIDMYLDKYPVEEVTQEKKYTLYGHIYNDKGVGVEGLIIEAKDISSVKEPVLGNPSMSLEDGSYRMYLTDKRPKDKGLDIRLSVLDASGQVLFSVARHNISATLELNANISTKLLKEVSEYEKLEKTLQRHANEQQIDLHNIADEEAKKIITFLAQKSKWDARLVGMYLMSQRYASEEIPASFYYVLFRADVSSKEQELYRINVDKALELFENAIKNNIIPKEKYALKKLKSTWQAKAKEIILNTSNAISLSSMGDMLSLSLKTDKDKETFVNLYYHGETDTQKTWENIEKNFSAKTVKSLRLNNQLGYLSFNNVGLISKISKDFNLSDPIELIKHGFYDEDKWDEYIDDKVLESIPIEGKLEEKRNQYKTWMSNQLKESYPTAIIAEKINNKTLKIEGSTKVKKEVYSTLYEEGLVLGETSMNTHIEKVEKQKKLLPETKKELQRIHRTYNLSPSDTAMGVLLEEKMDSSFAIMQYGKQAFVETLKNKISAKEASAIYDKAYNDATLITNIMFGYGMQKRNPLPSAIANPIDGSSVKKYPKLDELFGNLDFCTCGHCESVLSPAAYFVELLEFVKKVDLGEHNPQKRLFEKRPDIEHIKLSCENTKTVLPYIDLVNEVLEYWVANHKIEGFKGFNIDDENSEELISSPKHRIDDVYTKILTQEVYPLRLPFSRDLTLDRTYSKALNVPRYVRMEALLKNNNFDAYKKVFIEQLGLSEMSYSILTDSENHKTPVLYGFIENDNIHGKIEHAKAFCNRMDMDYSDFLLHLKTKFINPKHDETPINPKSIALVPIAGSKTETCNFKTLKLTYADKKVLSDFEYLKLVRFIRLWKHLGWSIERTDNALKVLVDFTEVTTKEALDQAFETFIMTLALFERVQNALEIEFHEVLKLWKDIGTAHTSKPTLEEISNINGYHILARGLHISIEELYDLMLLSNCYPLKTFKYLTVDKYVQPDILNFVYMVNEIKTSRFNTAKLNYLFRNKDGTSNTTPKQDEWLTLFTSIRTGLQEIEKTYPTNETTLSDEKAQELLTAVYGTSGAEAILAIFNIFVVPYEHSSQTLKQSIINVDDKINYIHEKKELSFVGIMDEEKKNNFQSVANVSSDFKDAIDVLFKHSNDSYASLIKTYPELLGIHANYSSVKELIVDKLPTLVKRLKKSFIVESLSNQFGEESQMLHMLLDTAISDNTYVLQSVADAEVPMIVDFFTLEQHGNILSTDKKTLAFYLLVDTTAEYQFQIDGLIKNTNISDFTIDATPIDIEEIDNEKKGYRTQNTIGLKANTAYLFKITANKSLEQATLRQKADEHLREAMQKEKMFSHDTMETYMYSYLRLHKALEWMKTIAFTSEEAKYFAKEGVLNLLPIKGEVQEEDLKKLYDALVNMLHYAAHKEKLDIKDDGFVSFLDNPTATYKIGEKETPILYKYVPWNQEDIDHLLTHYGYDMKSLSNLKTLQKISTVLDVLNTMGLRAKELVKVKDGNTLERVMKRNYDKASWLKLSQKIHDKLRAQQRDALVSYILQILQESSGTKHIDTPDKLFEYFLIDVQMDSCMKTSRIKQAISSVQLFVDRCLYNLEAGISPESIDAKMWEWMKRYRIWEANRKVFLHPENWLDPSLRSTKSPFFKEFEGELLQADINDELASKALLGYLEKLDRVSQLEICGMCRDDNERIHVIARTSGMKKVYYYRTYDGTWSPWEKISLDLEDGPVIPVWWKGRLFLFWTTVLQKGQDNTVKELTGKDLYKINGSVKLKIEINLNWSEYYNGKWQEKRMSDFNNPVSFNVTGEFNKNDLYLKYDTIEEENNQVLLIQPSLGLDKQILKNGFIFHKANSSPHVLNQSQSTWNDYLHDFEYLANIGRFNYTDTELIITSESCLMENSQNQDLTVDDCSTKLLSNTFYKITNFAHYSLEDDPFFLNDSQYTFYVDIEKNTIRIPEVITVGGDSAILVDENLVDIRDIPDYADIVPIEINPLDPIVDPPRDSHMDPTLIDSTNILIGNYASTILNNSSSFVFGEITIRPDRNNLTGRIE